MRNAILVDFRPTRNWFFQKVLEKQTNAEWEIVSLESNRNHQGTIQNGVTGFVIEKSQEQFDEILRKLEDKSVYARISKNARDFF